MDIEDVKRLRLTPTDILVLTVEHHLSDEAWQHIRDTMHVTFPDNRVVVFSSGMTLEVVDPT